MGVNGSGVNICTSLFRTTFQTTLLVLSYLCRWASCRGSLPQPMVVLLLFASAVSAPKGRRFLTVSLTILALRTTAELIHGLKYGPHEDWDDDYYYNHEDDHVDTNANTKRRRLPSSKHSATSDDKKMAEDEEKDDKKTNKNNESKNTS